MYTEIFDQLALYLCIGFIVAVMVDQSIRFTKQVPPYTAKEIAVSILLWPVIGAIFIYGIIKGYLDNESN